MLPQLAQLIAARGVEVVLLFGARTPAELIYGEDFRSFADSHPGFRFVPCFSRELPADPHADVRRGYVQDVLAEFAPDPAGDIAYLVRQPEHGRRLLRGAQGRRAAGAAYPPREVRQQQVVRRAGVKDT